MTKTAAQKQAAYRQRKADKLSEGSTAEGSTLSPGADCVPEEDTGKEEVDLTNPVGAVPPEPVSTDPVIEKLDELQALMREILVKVPTETPFHFRSSFNETRPDEEVPIKPTPKPVGDLTQCMICGVKLPPTETPRLVRELCHPCVRRNG